MKCLVTRFMVMILREFGVNPPRIKVMSTPTYVDLETITQADGAQSSRVPVPLTDDPYVAVRQAQLVDTDTESDLDEAPSEAEESQPLGFRVPIISEEFEASEPLGTRILSSHSPVSSDSTAPLLPDHLLTHVSPTLTPTQVSLYRRTARMAVRTQPTLSPGMSARIAKAAALSPSSFDKRERLDDEGHGLDDEDHGLDDEGCGLEGKGLGLEEEEEAIPEDPEDNRVYTDIPAYAPLAAPVQTLPSPKGSLGSLPVSPSSLVVPSPIASLVATLTATISVDEDLFIEAGAYCTLGQEWLETRSSHRGRVDTRLEDMSMDRYDDHRLIHDMLVQQAAIQRELQEMRGRVTTLEQERDRREQ
ncbi:hypothetical protein Tco_0958731 [Tanacetum coccineum]